MSAHILLSVCESAANFSCTTLCLSTANLLCSNSALTTIWGVDVFLSLSAGPTRCPRKPTAFLKGGITFGHAPPPRHHTYTQIHTHEREYRQTSVQTWLHSQTESLYSLLFLNLSFPLSIFLTPKSTHTYTLTKLTCQLQSDQEQKNSCQFETDIINGFGRGWALKTKGVQGRTNLKCTFILAGM